jgi:hypothetical protein
MGEGLVKYLLEWLYLLIEVCAINQHGDGAKVYITNAERIVLER